MAVTASARYSKPKVRQAKTEVPVAGAAPRRVELQEKSVQNLRKHALRSLVRVLGLAAGDAIAASLFWLLVMAETDPVSGWWEVGHPESASFFVAFYVSLLVTGNYGAGDNRRDIRRLFLGSSLTFALLFWGDLWAMSTSLRSLTFGAFHVVILWFILLNQRWVLDRTTRVLGWTRPRGLRTLLIGTREECMAAARGPAFEPGARFRSVGLVTHEANQDGAEHVQELRTAMMKENAEVVVVCGHMNDHTFQGVVEAARDAGAQLLSIPRSFSVLGVEPKVFWECDQPVIVLTSPALKGNELLLKRFVDIFGAAFGLLVFSPLFLMVALLIKMDSPGRVFFGSPRWGRHGKRVTMWKFRTMVDGAAEVLEQDPLLRKRFQENIKLRDDPRVTRVGRWLRRFSIDELPQLYSVLVGDMSLVGPRPKLIGEEDKYGAALETVLSVRPGLTGLWQVSGRASTSYEQRIFLDVKYASHPSLWHDFEILLRTVPVVLRGTGAH